MNNTDKELMIYFALFIIMCLCPPLGTVILLLIVFLTK